MASKDKDLCTDCIFFSIQRLGFEMIDPTTIGIHLDVRDVQIEERTDVRAILYLILVDLSQQQFGGLDKG